MKILKQSLLIAMTIVAFQSCENDDDSQNSTTSVDTSVNFQFKNTINVGGEGSAEISAFDPITNQIFTVNTEADQISIYDISDITLPIQKTPIDVSGFGAPNSVAVHNGKLAIAVEAANKQASGKIYVYNTADASLANEYTVGALPDMVTFTKDGNFILSANEGEPNDDYTVDPDGTVSIIDVVNNNVTTLNFAAFNSQEATLESQGFRVFGPNANLAADVEPEYITVSEDSQYAWVSLQENNGIAKINLLTKTIEAIYPLGYKDYSVSGNAIDASDKDGVNELKNWPVYGMYQPDAITSVNINGIEYIFSANEGDSREYEGTPGYVGEDRVKDITLDEIAFPVAEDYQANENIGRLKIALDLGDTDNDGDYDKLYNYGARSFSVWSADGNLLYDSGNEIATRVLADTPNRFNWDWEDNETDKRSDDKGAEPESVEILNIANQRYILFVGLERNSQVMVYDITNPVAPQFLQFLQRDTDYAPEGLLAIKAEDSPTGNALLIISYEDSGTVSIYENEN
ncbi:choice-of-anchor I family protein [uncultured Kordia sp.]|uniref:choice-of-anchor I family protein n=1 Tax=uncultured Kordia sp. TaxID=507699 RepID=UPI002603925F|nr:choice-of-anchor I family protein [uncultured Kordia sp.]